ncbi:hypothetical protein M231_04941 [Tremella mesenterica]|uniref:CENP-V/GFA domain-containing protein n=1 Tax=Tremella mesenterica TaxID=5217 RepID=A0A4Q1BJG6_TREME|nr:hypothetical protein M231_04941 [Tremella mesenterica]
MGNFPTLKILRGEDKIKVYKACMEFDKDDNCIESSTSKRSFCEECSSMLWNYHDDWPHWIYPFASTIDSPNPLPSPPKGTTIIAIKRDSCPDYVPLPKGAKDYKGYGPGDGIESWHKKHGAWVE